MRRARKMLGRQRKGRIQRNRTIAVDSSEQFRDVIRKTGKKGSLALGVVTLATALLAGPAYALPKGEQVKAGSSTFSRPNATTLNISQSTQKSIINWQNYSIAQGETVRYRQPSSSAVSLNRVTGSDPSSLYGSLSANGQVWVINPNGLLVGPNARINIGGFLASTLDLSDQDFLSGNYTFKNNASVGGILNQGRIQGGYVALLSPTIANEGTIQASLGKVALASGDQVTLNFTGNDLVGFVVDSGTASSSRISNTGTLSGNAVLMTAKGASDVVRNVVNNTGVIEARAIEERNGEIVLSGDGVTTTGRLDASGTQGGTIRIDGGFVALGGTISADGKTRGGTISVNSSGVLSLAERVLARGQAGSGGQVAYFSAGNTLETSTSITDASGATDGGSIRLEAQGGLLSSGTYLASGNAGQGGRIDLSGYSVRLLSATLDASGGLQGGLVRIGGAFQGGKEPDPSKTYTDGFLTRWGMLSPIANAERVFVNDSTQVDVSACSPDSAGGTAVVWSNKETTMLGKVDAAGASSGGYVEISSAQFLRRADILKIGAGKGGELLLDPKDIVIGNSAIVSGWSLQGIIGKGYTGGKNVPVENLESGESFGTSVALNDAGDRLVVGALYGGFKGDYLNDPGAVYLFRFSDTNFNGGSLEGIIGKGYTGGKNVDVDVSPNRFGASVSLNAAGDRLAIGADGDDGCPEIEHSEIGYGAVYLFRFSDTNFNGGSLEGTIGKGYTGGKNVDVSTLEEVSRFGNSVSLNGAGDRLAVGAPEPIMARGHAAVYLFSFSDTNFSGGALEDKITVSVSHEETHLGRSVSLNNAGDCLAAGDFQAITPHIADLIGKVYLFSFSDTNFNGRKLEGIIGKGYTGGKNVAVANLSDLDYFGQSASLNDAGDRLVVGAPGDDGYGNNVANSGAVYLFSFSDTKFSGGSLQGIIGKGYTGGGNVDVSPLSASDFFGAGVSLNGAGSRLAVGVPGDDGYGNSVTNSGAVHLFSWMAPTALPQNYAYGDLGVLPVALFNSDIATWLSGGSNLTLQANNDITLNAPIIVNNASGKGGNLTLAAGRSLILKESISTDNGNLTLIANDTAANGVVDAYRDAGAAVITQASGTSIDAGTGAVNISLRDGSGKTHATSGDITLTTITAGTISVENAGATAGSDIVQKGGSITDLGWFTYLTAGTHDITLNSAGNNFSTVFVPSGRNVTLVDVNNLNLSTMNVSGTLRLTAGGPISDNGTITVAGSAYLTAGANSIALDSPGNNFSTVSVLSGKNVTLVDANDLILSKTNISGTLRLTAGGPISDNDTITTAGYTYLTAGDHDITLDYGGNNFSTVSVLSGKNVTLVDVNALNLSTMNVGGDLWLQAGGAISDNGPITTTGYTYITAGAYYITLDFPGNNFSTVSVLSGKNVTLVDANALNLSTTTANGALRVTAGGPISDNGTITAAGSAYLAAGANSIALDSTGNDFSTVSASGKNITLVDANALNLSTTTISGTLRATTGGPISDSGSITVAGSAYLAAGANSIALDSPGNDFSTVSSSGKNITLVDANALNLSTTTAIGTLRVTAGGPISDSGTITVAGPSYLAAGANSVALDSPGNNFSTVFASGKNVTLVDVNALNLSTTTVSGTLRLTAGGPISDNGAITVAGPAYLAAGANDITLNSSSNNFSTVSVLSGRSVTLVDANALNLSTTTVSGDFRLTAGGTITDSGPITASGYAYLKAGTHDIILDSPGNNFSTVSVLSGKDVTLVDADALNLSTTTTSGTLRVTAGGPISDNAPLAVAGSAYFAAGTHSIALDSATNNFSTVSASGKNITLVDANTLNLSTTTASGTLRVMTNGLITDSGTIAAKAGYTYLTAGDNSIILDSPGNDFSTVSVLSGRNVMLTDMNALRLGASTMYGSVSISSYGTLTLLGDLNAVMNNVTLNAGTGAIDGAHTVTADNVKLSGSTIGLSAHPTINASGLLTLTATSQAGGVSANLLCPTDLDVKVVSAPGKVLLNGNVIYP